MPKITIIGTGYVGLVTGVCFAELGNTVACYDIDVKKIRLLKAGKVPFYEPNLKDYLIKNTQKGRLSFALRLEEALQEAEFIFICVGTPTGRAGGANLAFYFSALKAIRDWFAKRFDKTEVYLINKSTVPVGTAKEAHRLFKTTKTHIISNPEFLREGRAIEDFMKPDRIVIGWNEAFTASIKPVLQLYASFNCPKIITNWETSEIIKYASNAYLATKISFINEIAALCERVDANVKTVAEGMGYDPRIGKDFLRAGIGYGGSCFPKDVRALQHLSYGNHYKFKLLKSVIEVNNQQRKIAVEKIIKVLKEKQNPCVAVLGLSFKPETDDIRESASIFIIEELLKRGIRVRAYDPQAIPNARAVFSSRNRIYFCKSAYDAFIKSDAFFLATEWKELLNLDWNKVKKLMRTPVVIDGRNSLDKNKLQTLGFTYVGFGI